MEGSSAAAHGADTLRNVRRFVLALFGMGLLGTAADLLLTGQFEDLWQLAPLALLTVSALIVVWHLAGAGRSSLVAHRAMMALFIVSGLVGTFLHFRANIEFEVEMYPGLSGVEL